MDEAYRAAVIQYDRVKEGGQIRWPQNETKEVPR